MKVRRYLNGDMKLLKIFQAYEHDDVCCQINKICVICIILKFNTDTKYTQVFL